MKHVTKLLTAFMLALTMIVGPVTDMSLTARAEGAQDSVSYLDEKRNQQTCDEYVIVDADTTTFENGKWYVVKDSVTVETRITVQGTAHLILADGGNLNAKAGINTSKATLTVYGQKAGTGRLTARGSSSAAGIGGASTTDNGTIIINGGTINASGGLQGAGIGGGPDGYSGTVIINGGKVTAMGGQYGAGIGGANYASSIKVTINGGTVTATGGNSGAGIGGGTNSKVGRITINGGTVTANGGKEGAGIGGGYNGACSAEGPITINGGSVTANGGAGAAGIGSGYAPNIKYEGIVTINGGTVRAAGDTVGIGAGKGGTAQGSLIVDTGLIIYCRADKMPGEAKFDYCDAGNGGETEISRSKYMMVKPGTIHVHDFTYSADGNTITAKCADQDGICGLKDHSVSLTITAPTCTIYRGEGDTAAALAGTDEFNDATGANVSAKDIRYINRNDPARTESQYAPSGAGEYTAKITVEGKSASADYGIARVDSSVTAPTEKTLTCTGDAQALINAGSTADGWLYYAVTTEDAAPSDGSAYTTSIPTAADAGTYYVWYKVVGDNNHNDTEPACVTVVIAPGKVNSAGPESSVDSDPDVSTEQNPSSDEGELSTDPETGKYTVTFDANGGEGEMSAVQAEKGAELTLPECGFTAPEGKKFGGWDKGAPGTTIKVDGDLVIKAKWEKIPVKRSYTFLAKTVSAGSNSLKVSWDKVSSADGYEIWVARCGSKDFKKVKSVKGNKTSYTIKKLESGKEYKVYVKAYRKDGKKKEYIGKPTPTMHAIPGGSGASKTNPASVKVKKSKVELSLGNKNTSSIKATVKGVDAGKKVLDHEKKVRYYSTNSNIAEVSKKGKITAVNPGTCTIYVVASNGVRTKVKVTVTK